MRGLVSQGAFVERVPEEAQAEDRNGEAIAGMERVAPRKTSEGVVVILGARGQIPEGWVEEDRGDGNCVGGETVRRDLYSENRREAGRRDKLYSVGWLKSMSESIVRMYVL